MENPGGWFLLAKFVKKHLWKRNILIKDAVINLHLYLKYNSSPDFFSHILLVKAYYLFSP